MAKRNELLLQVNHRACDGVLLICKTPDNCIAFGCSRCGQSWFTEYPFPMPDEWKAISAKDGVTITPKEKK